MCSCAPGYALVDEYQCRMVDTCMAFGCSQTCVDDLALTKTCTCAPGFELKNNKRCVLQKDAGKPVILFSFDHQVRELDQIHEQYFAMFSDPNSASSVLAFDMNINDGTLYVATADHTTKKTRLLSSRRWVRPVSLFKHDKYENIVDLAVDWITNNLYMLDAAHSAIVVCKPADNMCAEIFSDLGATHSIVLDPIGGRVFWDDSGEPQRGIYQGSMDGKSKEVLIKDEVSNPYGLTLDIFADRLYWLEFSDLRVEFVHLTHRTRGELIKLPTESQPSGLTVFGDTFYWSDLRHQGSRISSCDKLTGSNVTQLAESSTGKLAFTVKAYHTLMQPQRRNPCWMHSCSHLCVISGPEDGDFSCLCPRYYRLKGSTQCEVNSSSILIAANENLFRVPVDTGIEKDPNAISTQTRIPQVAAMAVDDSEDVLYAVEDSGKPRIVRTSLKNSFRLEPVNVSIDFVSALHFDPIHRVLYWLDLSQNVIGIYNPQRQEESRIRLARHNMDTPLDFAVDFRRGRVYVITVNHTTNDRFIDVYRPSGAIDRTLKQVLPRPNRIAIDHDDGTVFIYDAQDRQISSLDPINGKTLVKVQNVSYIRHLYYWNDRLVWTGINQRGFFSAQVSSSEPASNFDHIVREEWAAYTTAIAFASDASSLASGSSVCSQHNGGCSHTCLDSVMEYHSCICPLGTQIGDDARTCVPVGSVTCQPNEFACSNGYQCIEQGQVCDSIGQCDDRSDETPTACNICASDRFKCRESIGCIEQKAVCDGDFDCPDRSDEANCTETPAKKCNDEEYQCLTTGKCIPKTHVCDGLEHCEFSDDEFGCPCKQGYFVCKGDNRCLPPEAICDGWENCWHGDDEKNCSLVCPPRTQKCKDACVAVELLCDGVENCSDGSDEADCTPSELSAGQTLIPKFCAESKGAIWCDGNCIMGNDICDGVNDCADNRDELNCTQTTPDSCEPLGLFLCQNNKCIPPGQRCDGENDCGDNSDESPELCHVERQASVRHCMSDEFRCANRQCVKITQVCNGVDDCDDGSDEGRHCPRHECHSSPCQHRCHRTPDGYRCSCHQGYRLASDHRSCDDINECAEAAHCSHYCENTKGGFICTCGPGYHKTNDNRTCATIEPNPILVFVAHNEIRALSKRHNSLHVLTAAQESVVNGLTFDASTKTVYWSEETTIWKIPIGDNVFDPHAVRVHTGFLRARHLALDWTTGNMYMVEEHENIVACLLNFTHCTYMEGYAGWKRIRSLALAANDGLMFYSYWDSDSTKASSGIVVRAEMDGSGQTVIIANMTFNPSHLQVDFIHRGLYLVDTRLQVVEKFDFQGNNRMVLLRGHHVHSFALFPDSIIWSEMDRIFMTDWFAGGRVKMIASDARANLMTVMHRVRQPLDTNPCDLARCTHLCLRNLRGYACGCDPHYRLDSDNQTCVERTDIGTDETAQAFFQLDLCKPPCTQHGRCVLHRNGKLATCVCEPGYSGTRCEVVDQTDSSGLSHWTVIEILLSLVLIGVAIIMFTLHRYKPSLLKTIGLSAKYRATDMKQLVGDDDDEQDSGRIADLEIQRDGTLFNPLYSLAAESGENRVEHEGEGRMETSELFSPLVHLSAIQEERATSDNYNVSEGKLLHLI
ncbi:vitellogenin receptor-like [Tropilaelaps mercedesae]|uniref:Vitellogenin receptor-like n=1 Tax=Tropilaelaps mercedesae TaxID=418985 RepID=A0A1V9XK80_9ACAR|nr:vitellogenin receptor-like [Tropilaelaps mercedesae]